MSKLARKVAHTHIRTSAEADVQDLPPTHFIDLIGFFVAADAYLRLKGDDDDFVSKALPLLRRFQDDLVRGIQKYFTPLITEDSAFVSLRNDVLRATRTTSGWNQASVQAQACTLFMRRLRAKPTTLRDVFSDTRAATSAFKIATIVEEDDPASILTSLATVPPASRLRVLRDWVQEAAKHAGVSPPAIDVALADASVARDLGDRLHVVDAQLASTDPVSATAADLQAQRLDIIEEIEDVAGGSPVPAVVMAAAITPASKSTDYATATARAQRLSPDQEVAMMIRGKGVIAAGAGSGKTSVLASKVVYHIQELGVPPGAIIATSFSRKSAAELRRRIDKYGADIPASAGTGFGTTHSIAGKLLREYGGPSRNEMKGHEQSNLFRLAMEQVQMKYPGAPTPPPAQGLFAEYVKPQDSPPSIGFTFYQACENAFKRRRNLRNPYLESFIASFFDSSDRWYSQTMRATNNLRDPRGLSDKQSQILKNIFEKLGVEYSRSLDPNFATPKVAAAPQKNKGLQEKYRFYSAPAGQWFNLGLELVEPDGAGVKKPIPMGVFRQAITKYKGRAVSPSEAWHESAGRPEAAVYAAYEWLKGPDGEEDFRNAGDFDDLLLDASRMLLSSPKTLRQVNSRFKVILVDEAQDQNRAQHLMFGLIAGFIDPAKVGQIGRAKKIAELARDDGKMEADTYVFVGDDKQCVERNSVVTATHGPVKVGDLQPGDEIQSYRNGEVVYQKVRHVVPSSWTRGFKVTTSSGYTLTMSPNHKLWASEPRTGNGQMAVYLMYRKDMGFRIGITNKGKVDSRDNYLNSYGGRAFLEKAERLWVLDIVQGREEALLHELDISLTYGIPTMVFGGENRGLNQERIDTIFKKHGQNGARLLEDRHLSFDLPHWMSQSYTKHGRERHTIQFNAHGNHGSSVSLEWTGPKFDDALTDFKIHVAGERRRIRQWFNNYRESLAFAKDLAQRTGANLSYRLSTPAGVLREMTAAGLFVGMFLPVLDAKHNKVVHDEIISIEHVDGSFIDLDVVDASTFFANGILTSNSIYEFRSADPDAFIDMSDLVEGGAGFKTKLLKTNYRSGKLIVDAANRLISHNSRQIPMTCNANPQRVDQGGVNRVDFAPIEGRDMSTPAAWFADQVAEDMEDGRAGEKGYDAFGIGLRSNAEAYAYGLELLKRGIPFRTKVNFFSDPNTQALLHWLTIADEGLDGNVDRVNAAVLSARSAPASKLGSKFETTITQNATGNYVQWLDANWSSIYGARGDYTPLVRAYLDNLKTIASMKGSPAEEVFQAILDLRGFDGRSVLDVLVDRVRENEEVIAEIRAESPDGQVSDDAIKEVAFAPIEPLRGLIGARPDLTEAMKYVRQLQSANSKLSADDDPKAKGFHEPAVTIGTMHSWKGLEVERMFIPFVGGRFPRAGGDEGALASERRLAYVAVTRGEHQVTVMNIPTLRTTSTGMTVQKSQFIDELCVPPAKVPDPSPVKMASSSPQDEDAMDEYLQNLGD